MLEKFVKLVFAVAMTVVVTGCETTDPYTREKKTSEASKRATDAAVQCGVGVAVNAVFGRRKISAGDAVASTALCAIAGGVEGARIDDYERRLLAEFRSAGVKIALRQSAQQLVVNEPITFAANSSNLSGRSLAKAQAIGKILRKYNKIPIDVIGHTAAGEAASLGSARASAVRSVIRGYSTVSISTTNMASKQAIGDNSTETGRARNRRVVIFIQLKSHGERGVLIGPV